MIDRRRVSEAAIRNREPILQVLQRHVAAGDHVLELAAGSGQHAVFLAPRLPVAAWQPTDPDAEARASIDAWRAAEPCPVIQPALALDVEAPEWPVARADVLLAINLVHISPWSTTVALFDGAARLGPRIVYLYGPYRRGGEHTAPSNVAFDAWLHARDPAYGVRDLEAVLAVAEARGYAPVSIPEMPANNLSVVLARGDV